MKRALICGALLTLPMIHVIAAVPEDSLSLPVQHRMAEWTIESRKVYPDPFNDVEFDVVFTKGESTWRVPSFWRGGQRWTVRFAPPEAGTYEYRWESSDKGNAEINGRSGRVTITEYSGQSTLLKHGALRVSDNKRYFEYADGTPFYWLGDTWWTNLSDRLPWEGFQKLAADRKAKGFTVVQIVAGLVPIEESPPSDPGFCNEGGCVWDATLSRINPGFFDYADRRIEHLADSGIVPALVGGWQNAATVLGAEKLKKHWRYLIARYGAYPVLWVVGGEVFQPRENDKPELANWKSRGDIWAEVAKYLRQTDPYHHPITTHEFPPPRHGGFTDQSLTDFHFPQSGHFGWPSLATEVVQLTSLYASVPTKPVIESEVAYETHGADFYEDAQRAAFWLAMLNGAAGYTYGSIEVAEAFTADKPLHRRRWSLTTWEEAMQFPGSYQVGMNARFLRLFPWQRFEPHPEWVIPRGTTLLEPNDGIREIELDLTSAHIAALETTSRPTEDTIPSGEWQHRGGTFRQPYAAGIPGEVRIVYMPYFGAVTPGSPTVLGLEAGVRYHAYYFDPVRGVKVDLGAVEQPAPGAILFRDASVKRKGSAWIAQASAHANAESSEEERSISLVKGINEADLSASVNASAEQDIALILRYQDGDNYVCAVYSAAEKAIYLQSRVDGKDQPPRGKTAVPALNSDVRLTAELRDNFGIVSITDGQKTATSPIEPLRGGFEIFAPKIISGIAAVRGGVGVRHRVGSLQSFGDFQVRSSQKLPKDESLERKLFDAEGTYRGTMSGTPEWDDYGRHKLLLLDAYRPERVPVRQDWILVLDARKRRSEPWSSTKPAGHIQAVGEVSETAHVPAH